MSFILDALKKSEQQRQLGTTPGLQAIQFTVDAPKRPSVFNYGLLAIVLLAAGVMIGLFRPWQVEQIFSESESSAQRAPITVPQQASIAPIAASPEYSNNAMQSLPEQTFENPVPPGPATPKQRQPAGQDEIVVEQKVMQLYELPAAIQQELPEMAIQLHAYSGKPGESMVSINSIRLREGGYLMTGLKLEQITPDGMVFSYRGYRFKRGIR